MSKEKLKFLVATDFSPESKLVFKTIDHFAAVSNPIITLINVIPSYWKFWLYARPYKKEIMNRLESLKNDYLHDKQVDSLMIKVGNPANSILDAAISAKAQLIILGAKKSSKEGRYHSGTTLNRVIRGPGKSVLVCKGTKRFSKILVGVDGSPYSKKVLMWARDLAHAFNATLHVVMVLDNTMIDGLGITAQQIKIAEKKYVQEQETVLDKLIEKHDFSDVKLKTSVMWGRPADTILSLAEDKKFDLIVIGTKGRSNLKRVLLGGTAEKICEFVPCSLLVVR